MHIDIYTYKTIWTHIQTCQEQGQIKCIDTNIWMALTVPHFDPQRSTNISQLALNIHHQSLIIFWPI